MSSVGLAIGIQPEIDWLKVSAYQIDNNCAKGTSGVHTHQFGSKHGTLGYEQACV